MDRQAVQLLALGATAEPAEVQAVVGTACACAADTSRFQQGICPVRRKLTE